MFVPMKISQSYFKALIHKQMQTKDGFMILPFLIIFQERLSYIGPEEFVQAFVQKGRLLDNDKVTSGYFSKNKPLDKETYTVVMQPFCRKRSVQTQFVSVWCWFGLVFPS